MTPAGKKRVATLRSRPRRKNNFENLDKSLEAALDDYFKLLAGHDAGRLHKLVFEHVEKKLLSYVLRLTGFNQSRAAELLGLSRSTLRSKARAYGLASKETRISPKKKISKAESKKKV